MLCIGTLQAREHEIERSTPGIGGYGVRSVQVKAAK